jgi:hypothetical protein
MITKQQYVEYLLSTPVNYTCANLADHLDDVSHDAVSDYLRRERHTARKVWELAQPLITDSPDAYLILDDSVQDKRYSRKIDLVKRQYSGVEGGLVRGIGVVNLVHSIPLIHYGIAVYRSQPEIIAGTEIAMNVVSNTSCSRRQRIFVFPFQKHCSSSNHEIHDQHGKNLTQQQCKVYH